MEDKNNVFQIQNRNIFFFIYIVWVRRAGEVSLDSNLKTVLSFSDYWES